MMLLLPIYTEKKKNVLSEMKKTLKCAIRRMERMASGIRFLLGYYKAMYTAQTKLESIHNEMARLAQSIFQAQDCQKAVKTILFEVPC